MHVNVCKNYFQKAQYTFDTTDYNYGQWYGPWDKLPKPYSVISVFRAQPHLGTFDQSLKLYFSHSSFAHRDKRMKEIKKRWKKEEKEKQIQNEAIELAPVHEGHGGQMKGQQVQEGQQEKCYKIGA